MIVARKARRSALVGGANEATEKFGPLKVILASILAVQANREVRSFLSSQAPSANTFLGDCRPGKQG